MGKLAIIDDTDAFRDHCGVVGVYGEKEAANLVYLGLYALQHRGQESAGIVAGEGERLARKIAVGLVADVFDEESIAGLPGPLAIGHVRYATAGEPTEHLRDAQPLLVRCQAGPIAVGHNGNLTNARTLRHRLEGEGSIFQTTSDTEVICHLMARSEGSLLTRLQLALREVAGAYSLVVTGDGRLYGVRDPSGVRPLVLGKLKSGWVLASETCAFDLIEAELVREVLPGEIVIIDENGVRSEMLSHAGAVPTANCVFEHVYFARPDSIVFGTPVHVARKTMGRELARECPTEADLVVPVPDSGIYAAMGYAEESGIPFEMGLVRNHYVGRTFIEPEQGIRNFGVRLKLNPVRAILEGKRVVVVDDSIVRGTTSRKIVETIRSAGAREVHVRISAPPTTNPCFYGIDTPTRAELIAAKRTIDEIRDFIHADSLGYLSRSGLHRAMGRSNAGAPHGLCDACFTGDYPITVEDAHG
jgi:amidophosphoribosyltransferase